MKTNRKIACLALTAALALTCTMAGAGEVVRFQDGRYLKVEGHQVHGEAVKLMMANRSVLVLPLNRIDTIRSGDVVVYAAGISWTTSPQELQAVALKPRRNLPETPDRERG
ncbi:MAG: hypothetical protein IFK94_12740 [Acidobacteria bacterium]|uniref:DUF5666 domain-containing protein n=1 Tax=Candidatus Polarisedimenticola svalbardensis TaxID=2886004 RepID=A0A8J7C398_9BACT|nr:hypothetical protein [Candidatus Polarisedimenticola svalbardensis]